MLLIHWGCLKGLCVFNPTDGISIIFLCILNISFALPTFREPIKGYLTNLFNFLQFSGGLNYI